MHPSLHARYAGTLLGVLAGDSLGAPYEKREPDDVAADLLDRGGLVPFDYPDPWGRPGHFPAGRPTDDSELTAALAQSLIECNGSNPAHQYQYFKRAVDGESFVWDGKADGFGGTTRRMLEAETYEEACRRADRPSIPSNGSLMRSAPLALWYHRRAPEELPEATRHSSMVTHLHETAIACCVVYVNMLDRLLHGHAPADAWSEARAAAFTEDARLGFLLSSDAVEKPEATNVWMRPNNPNGLAGTAAHTLHIAVWCALNADGFRDGLEKAVSFAGDTDTQAAVAGSLLGAAYGVDAIPEAWQSVLKGYGRMTELASGLY